MRIAESEGRLTCRRHGAVIIRDLHSPVFNVRELGSERRPCEPPSPRNRDSGIPLRTAGPSFHRKSLVRRFEAVHKNVQQVRLSDHVKRCAGVAAADIYQTADIDMSRGASVHRGRRHFLEVFEREEPIHIAWLACTTAAASLESGLVGIVFLLETTCCSLSTPSRVGR